MKKLLSLLAVIAIAAASVARADDENQLATKLQNLSVTVHADDGQGSGTIITRSGMNFVLTAGHVVEANRSVVELVKDGKTVLVPKFTPVTVVKEIYVDDRSVGTTTVEGEVIAYSSADYGQDLALIKLRSNVISDSVEFYQGKTVPVGTDVVHIGSLLGQTGSNSYTVGTVSQVGRTYEDKVYDQSSCASFPGSSGGGIYTKTEGRYAGMLVRGAAGGFNLFIPLRRIHEWAKNQHVEFIFDPQSTIAWDKIKLEDGEPVGKSPRVRDSGEDHCPFLMGHRRPKPTPTATPGTSPAA